MPQESEQESNVSEAGRESSTEGFAAEQEERLGDDATPRAGGTTHAEAADNTAGAAGQGNRREAGELGEQLGGDLATAAVTSLVVAALNAELLPGVLIGAGALLARRLLPDAGPALQPLLRETVKAGYGVFATVQSVLAEAAEQVEDIVAEARAEQRERTRPTAEKWRGQA